MRPNWTAKRVATFPKEWKVVPIGLPAWEDNKPTNYFDNEMDARKEADKRNQDFLTEYLK